MPAMRNIRENFRFLFNSLLDHDFGKSYRHWAKSERDLLPLIRFYLLGCYGDVRPEEQVRHAGATCGHGRLDFIVGNTAIEIAVRPEGQTRNNLTAAVNWSERIKLLQHPGPAALVLFDFSKERSLTPPQVQKYRQLPSLGRGNWKITSFTVLYYYRNGAATEDEGATGDEISIIRTK